MPYVEWTRYLEEFSPESAVAAPPSDLYRASESAVAIDGWDGVGDQQWAEFRDRGFLVIRNAFDSGEVTGAIEAIAALLDGTVPSYKPSPWGKRHGVLLRPGVSMDTFRGEDRLEALVLARALVEHEPRLIAMGNHSRLNHFLRRVMADEPVLIHDMVRTKPPSEGDKPWHQDLTHFNVHHSVQVVTAWIALDNAPLESGCLYFIPGTHLHGPTKHVFGRDYQIPDTEVSRIGQVAAPVEKGSCVLLNALVHHGSPPNRSLVRRLALQLTFKPANARMITNSERILAFSGSSSE